MVYLLLVIFIIIFIISYTKFKDFLHPAVLICISFIFASICACYNVKYFGSDLRFLTMILLTINVVSFVLGGVIAKMIKARQAFQSNEQVSEDFNPIYISSLIIIVFIVMQIVIIIICTSIFLDTIGGFNGFRALSQQMAYYRQLSLFQNDADARLPSIFNHLRKVSLAIALVNTYVCLNNRNISSKKQIIQEYYCNSIWLLSSIIYLPLCIMLGGRMEAFFYLFACFSIFGMLKTHYWGIKSLKITHLILFSIVFIILFYTLNDLMGRSTSRNIIDNITFYFGGGIKAFDDYIQEPIPQSHIWGKETFYAIIRQLDRFGIINANYSVALEFRYFHGGSLGNVYTNARRLYHDFGISGIILLQTLFGFIMSLFYSIVHNRIINNRVSISCIFYCIISHSIIMMPFEELFYNTILSTNYLLILICIIIAASTVNTKKIKIIESGVFSDTFN